MSNLLNEYKIIIKGQNDFFHLFECCENLIKLDGYNSLCIDISGITFFNPSDVLMLVQCIIYLITKRPDIIISIENNNTKTQKYINEIGLIRFCNTNYEQPNKIEFIESQTAMPILRIEQSSLEEYVMTTLRYIGSYCPEKDLTVLSVGVKESINNVYDHSQSTVGAYVFCQYYPKIKTIRVCVSDMGVGIPANVKKHKPDIISDSACIKWAIQEHNTTKTLPSNAGLGLANIASFVRETESSLKILSGAGQLQIKEKRETYYNNSIKNFVGTLIEFDIKVDNLVEKEDCYINDLTF